MLYVDIPTQPELHDLVAARGDVMISLYLATTPDPTASEPSRIRLKQLRQEAMAKLEAAGVDKRTQWPIEEQIDDLVDDDAFWRFQATGLAVFVTPDSIRTYRLPTTLTETAQVSDRFHLKPLLRVVSTSQHAFVLALAENEVRVIELLGDAAAQEISVEDLPSDVASVARVSNVNRRSYAGRLGGSEGQKEYLRQYCRAVDAALRSMLAGRSEPLILAVTEPLLSIYRSVNSYPNLADGVIRTSPVRIPPHELGALARPIIDGIHAAGVRDFHDLYSRRLPQERATTTMEHAARAATFGAVDTLVVDIDSVIPGEVDDETGEITLAEHASATSYGVVDEIAGRVLATGGRVLAVRSSDIPDESALAAVLRFPI